MIIEIELPSGLAVLRDASDQMAARGVPPHVTVLFPFMAVDALTSVVQSALARLAQQERPFVTSFARVDRPEQTVWLVPTDQKPFLRLTASVTALWPEYLPYEGVHDELITHLTLVETADAHARGEAWVSASRAVPFSVSVRELTVIVEGLSGMWRTHWRLPFGAPPIDAPTPSRLGA